MLRRRRDRAPKLHLATLEPKWRRPVEAALASCASFETLVDRLPAGPSRDRLDGLRPRLNDGVLACWDTATRAQAASGAIDVLEPERVTQRMKDVRRRLAELPEGGEHEANRLQSEIGLLSDQLASVGRLLDAIDDAAERLRLLELRLDAAVARAAELLLAPSSSTVLASVEQELVAAVDEAEALRQAVAALEP